MPKSPPTISPNEQHNFSTDHLLENLNQRTISGGIVQAGAQSVQFILSLSYNVALARLLTPQDFGLVAMVMTVIGFLQIFRDMGLSTATIQRADITQAQVSNLFWLNVAVSGTISLLIAGGAPLIARFYHEPRLINIALALAAYFVLNGLAGQHVALLNRQMRFLTISLIEMGSMATGMSVGVALALGGYGYWALVAATLTQAVLRVVAIWSVSRWRPHWPVRGVGTRPLISFGANLTVSGFLYSTSAGCDSLVIGRVYGSDGVGLYTRAAALIARPIEQLINPVYTVVVPALSRLQGQPDRYRTFYLQIFEGLAIAGFLLAALVLPLARPLTLTVLGAKWEAAAVIFAGLSLAAIHSPLSSAASWLYTSQGRGSDLFNLSVIEAILTVGAVFLGLGYGPAGVAISLSLAGLLVKLPLTFQIAGRRGPVGTRDLWSAFFKHIHVFLIVGGVTWGTYFAVSALPPIKQLLICLPAGLLAAASAILLSPPSRRVGMNAIEALQSMRKVDPSKKNSA